MYSQSAPVPGWAATPYPAQTRHQTRSPGPRSGAERARRAKRIGRWSYRLDRAELAEVEGAVNLGRLSVVTDVDAPTRSLAAHAGGPERVRRSGGGDRQRARRGSGNVARVSDDDCAPAVDRGVA